MNIKLATITALLLFATSVQQAYAQNDLSFYPVRTLAEAAKDSLKGITKKADFYLDGRQLKSRSTVTFTGDVRKLSEERRRFVELWLESRGLAKNVISALENEAKFEEGTTFYWMPVRQKTLDLLQKDIKKGDRVDVYTILAGAVRVGGEVEPMFVIGGVTPVAQTQPGHLPR